MRKKKIGFLIVVIIVGALIGSALGEVLGLVLPDGVVKDFFLKSVQADFGPATVNIILLTFTVGIGFKVNIAGVIGILIAAYALRWFE
jgi:uncharacterized membrane protein